MSTMMSSSSTAVAKSQAQVIAVVVFPLREQGPRCRGLRCRGLRCRGLPPGAAARPLCLSPLPNRNR